MALQPGHPPLPSLVPRHQLFRSLLSPLPSLPLAFRFADVEHPPLYVCALHANQANAAYDAAASLPDDAKTDALQLGLLAQSIHCDGARLFLTVDHLTDLPQTELARLISEALPAFASISPTYLCSDYAAWHDALREGCKHKTNTTAFWGLGGSYDEAGGRYIERPDLYFGRPLGELLDCHWMAYRAARTLFEERNKR